MIMLRSSFGRGRVNRKRPAPVNDHREKSSGKAGRMVFLEPAQIAELRKLARDHGTSLADEIGNAVDAYVLGIAPTDVRKLDEVLDKLNATTDRAKLALDEALAVAKAAQHAPPRKTGKGAAGSKR